MTSLNNPDLPKTVITAPGWGYRIWPNKWCEQWGIGNVTCAGCNTENTLLIPMRDTNYQAVASRCFASGREASGGIYDQSTTKIRLSSRWGGDNSGGNLGVSFYICGYAA